MALFLKIARQSEGLFCRSSTTKINKTALEADGLLKKYSTTEETYRLLPKEIKEES